MKIKFFIIGALAALLFHSCEKDVLDKQPLDEYSESTLWSSENDALSALNGIYDGWESGYRIIYMDCASDNAYNQFPWEGFQEFGNMQLLTPTNSGYGRWDFTTIQRANWFLENVDQAPIDEDLMARMKAEARFLRAYQYFYSAQVYGDFPLILEQITPEEANEVERTPKVDVIDFVLSELREIAEDLPISYSGNDLGRVTKGAALALRGRVALFHGNYDDAVADSKEVIDMGVYSLFPDFADLFRIQNENNEEVILNIEHIKDDYAFGEVGIMPSSSYGGWSSINPTQSLVDAYEMANGKTIDAPGSGFNENQPYKNRDPRLTATVVVPGQNYNGKFYNSIESSSSDFYSGNNNSKTGYLPAKLTSNLSDYDDMWNTGLNIIVLRYAEVLLNYAEAKIELGQIDQSVYDAINLVRNRANMPDLDQSLHNGQSKMREAVRRERRVELAMEGLRWFDVQRWEIAEEVMNGQVYGARLGTVDGKTGAINLSSERIKVENRVFNPSKNYLWPVPQSEIDINKNLKQNPGY